MCTTFAECRTVMITVLTVMSGMNLHTIRVTWMGGLDVGMVGQSVLLGQTVTVDSVAGSMLRFEEKSL
jgi:hypothetical protein